MADELHIGNVRGKLGPLAEIALQDGKVALRIKRAPTSDLIVVMNLAQAVRLAELLAVAVKAQKAATP